MVELHDIILMVAIVVLLGLLVPAIIKIGQLNDQCAQHNDEAKRLKAANAALDDRLRNWEDERITSIHWTGMHYIAQGVNVGLDPTEQITVTLTAKGAEAEKVIKAYREREHE